MSSEATEDPIRELDVVALLRDMPEHGLRAGQTGTVVMTYDDPQGYEVEFIEAPRRSVLAAVTRADLLKLRCYRHAAAT